jgi:SAM-dependent methyltransferase
MRLVDFGCGAGSLTCGFASLIAPGEVLGVDISEEAIERARALAEQAGLTNIRFSVANVNELDLPTNSFEVAHFSGVLMYLNEPERALRLAFRSLKSGGIVAACEANLAGNWTAGPNAEAVLVVAHAIQAENKAKGGGPLIGGRLRALVREAGFEHVVSKPGYSAALSDVKSVGATARELLTGSRRATLIGQGITAERCDQLLEEISVWAESEDSISAFAECAVIAWKP